MPPFFVRGGTTGGGGVSASDVREIRYAIGTGAAQPSVTAIPAGARVIASQLEVTTPYDVGATIDLGNGAASTLLQSTAALDNNPQAAGLYDVSGDIAWGGAAAVVLATIGGAPAAGAGFVIVRYVETPAL